MLTIDYDLLDIKDGERILDVGCGGGRHTWQACKQSSCLTCALDIDRENLTKTQNMLNLLDQEHKTKGKWLVIEGDITNLPFPNNTFDKIVCSEVLEHIHNDVHGIYEMVRVLKGDGILAVSVPSYLQETICWRLSEEYHNTPGGHIRIYRTKELREKLKRHNLQIFASRRKHALHSFYWISRCFFGMKNENALIPSLYYKFLVWDIYHGSRPIRWLESILNKIFPKSLVLYSRKCHNG
jgi:ubiquinone/menaquinone biosynthesis C-methylase UbiE